MRAKSRDAREAMNEAARDERFRIETDAAELAFWISSNAYASREVAMTRIGRQIERMSLDRRMDEV